MKLQGNVKKLAKAGIVTLCIHFIKLYTTLKVVSCPIYIKHGKKYWSWGLPHVRHRNLCHIQCMLHMWNKTWGLPHLRQMWDAGCMVSG